MIQKITIEQKEKVNKKRQEYFKEIKRDRLKENFIITLLEGV